MIRTFTSIACAALIGAATLSAQTQARASVVTPCNTPAPAQSLRPAPLDDFVVRMNSSGFAAVEIERATPRDGWVFEADPRRPGFSGRGYWRWAGPNLFSSPGRGIVGYRVWVDTPGRYQIRIHNRHDHPDASLENDCWMRVNGSSWSKTYSNTGSNVRVWNWHFRFDPGHGVVSYNFNQGMNLIEISGRSTNFMLDRMHVFPTGFAGENINLGTTGEFWQRPVIGQSFALLAGDPSGASNLGAGTATLLLSDRRSLPCGTTLPGLGEVLLGSHRTPDVLGSMAWSGAGNAARFTFPLPNDSALVGTFAFVQGALVDGTNARLTDMVRLDFGDS